MDMNLLVLAQEAAGRDGILPEALMFLNWGWWVVHVVGIAAVFGIGFAVGKSKGRKADTTSA